MAHGTSLRCPHCHAEQVVFPPTAPSEFIRCPSCGGEIPLSNEAESGKVYEAQVAEEAPSATTTAMPWYLLAVLLLLGVAGSLLYLYSVRPRAQDSQDNGPNAPVVQSEDAATVKGTAEGGKDKPGKNQGLAPPPAMPPPPKLPALDADLARSVIAEKQAHLIGVWHTDLPYPITIVYGEDGQVTLSVHQPGRPPQEVKGVWRIVEAVTRQIVTIEWEGPARQRQRFNVVFELDGDIQHPIWGQPRLIPKLSKLK